MAVGLAALGATTAAHADGVNARASTEVAGYKDSAAVNVLTPSLGLGVESPTAGWSINGRYLVDVVSAASPDIVATASPRWTEVRHAGNLGFKFKPGLTGIAGSGAISSTPDYLALSAGGTFLQELDDKNWSTALGYTFGRDTVGRTGTAFSVFSRTFDTHAITASVSRVLSPSAVFTLAGDVILERGDQSKPYRYIPLFAPGTIDKVGAGAGPDVVAATRIQARPLEQLPLQRDRFALTGRVAVRLSSGTLRLEERLYGDSWQLLATSTDFRYMHDLSKRVIVWPHLRFHFQTPASFYQRAYTSQGPGDIPALRTGDRELGALTNTGAGLGIRFALGHGGDIHAWALSLTGDGVWTHYADALYIKDRFAALSIFSLEATF